jgi:hypothetical protein
MKKGDQIRTLYPIEGVMEVMLNYTLTYKY